MHSIKGTKAQVHSNFSSQLYVDKGYSLLSRRVYNEPHNALTSFFVVLLIHSFFQEEFLMSTCVLYVFCVCERHSCFHLLILAAQVIFYQCQ